MIESKQEYKIGDNLKLMKELASDSIDTIITSPPYWGLRDYGVDGQIGLEPTLEEYHDKLLAVTAECMRVLKPTGVMFWNHGDSYGGSASQGFGGKGGTYAEMAPHSRKRPKIIDKCLVMQNERLIIRMIDDQGWILRNRIIWNKPNGMPSSVTDRFSNKYEPVYMLVKNKKYWFDLDAVRVPFKDASEVQYRKKLRANKEYNVKEPYKTNTPYKHNTARITSQESPNRMWGDAESLERQISAGKNPGDVWQIPTQPYKESHFAVFPTALVEPMIKAACPAEICPVCGWIRDRIVDKGKSLWSKNKNIKSKQYPDKFLGWTSCNCNAGWNAGTVLDLFAGSGTVGEVARNLNRNAILFELNPEYGKLIANRIKSYMQPISEWI